MQTAGIATIKKFHAVIIPRYITLRHNGLWEISFFHNVKNFLRLKFKTMAITCRFQVFDVRFSKLEIISLFVAVSN